VPVLDDGELLEQLAPLRISLDFRQRPVQKCGIPLVAVVFVPVRIGLRPVGSLHPLSIVDFAP
jgi:hypothetical protein